MQQVLRPLIQFEVKRVEGKYKTAKKINTFAFLDYSACQYRLGICLQAKLAWLTRSSSDSNGTNISVGIMQTKHKFLGYNYLTCPLFTTTHQYTTVHV